MVTKTMSENQEKPSTRREYPEFYEKAVPIAIGVLTIFIVIIIIIALGVILGAANGAA